MAEPVSGRFVWLDFFGFLEMSKQALNIPYSYFLDRKITVRGFSIAGNGINIIL